MHFKNMFLILKAVIYLSTIILALSFLIVYLNSHPPRYPLNIPPSSYGLKFESVEFTTPDKVLLKGWFVKGVPVAAPFRVRELPQTESLRLPVIIICHGLGANKSDFTELSSYLSKAGYHVLLFDFRGHGESKGNSSSLGFFEQMDLKSAIDYVKSRADVDIDKVGVYGFSLGAAVAILTASEDKDIKAVVSDSSFTSLKVQGERLLKSSFLPKFPFLYTAIRIYEIMFKTDIEKIAPVHFIEKISPTPIFIIGGEGDTQMPATDAEELFKNAREPKSLWIVKGASHGGTVISAGREYEKRLIEFFDKYLKEQKRD
ncbi:MAG: alpha/beta fold hydrolase [Nitrospinae bacterium]|nr:alpha/beta fold hydrolase [Nitrospinota bacterium]